VAVDFLGECGDDTVSIESNAVDEFDACEDLLDMEFAACSFEYIVHHVNLRHTFLLGLFRRDTALEAPDGLELRLKGLGCYIKEYISDFLWFHRWNPPFPKDERRIP